MKSKELDNTHSNITIEPVISTPSRKILKKNFPQRLVHPLSCYNSATMTLKPHKILPCQARGHDTWTRVAPYLGMSHVKKCKIWYLMYQMKEKEL